MPSSKAPVLLVDFISKLLNNKPLQSKVLTNPDEAMKRSGLTAAQMRILRSHDAGKIGRAVTAELKSFSRAFVKRNPEA